MKNFFLPPLTLIIWLILLPASSLSIRAQPVPEPAEPGPSDPVGPLTLRDESMDQVLALLERWTGKTILRPQALPPATITISLRGSVTREEAIRALETLLTLNGIAISPFDEKFLKVTALTAAKSEAPELIVGSTLGLPPSGRMASKVFQLDFQRVAEFVPKISPLLNPAAGSAPVILEKANAALITDSITNLQRIETLVARFDRPLLKGLELKFYSLHFAKASEVVNKMRTILTGPMQEQLGPATTYNPDDRTNQVILAADPRLHEFFDELIARLDTKSDANTRNEVIYLKHAAAKDVATSLSQLVAGQNTAAKSAGQETLRQAQAAPPAAPQPGAAPAPLTAATAAGLSLPPDSTAQFSSFVTILPEERSNSLIVSGTVDDLRLITELVGKIDILLAQVRIEVVIAEVTLDNSATSGISALGLTVDGDKLVGFSGSAGGIAVTNGVVTRPGIAGSGPVDLAAEISIVTTPRKSNANILSVPNIITSHNREGKIFVGESRPVISSFLSDATGNLTGTGNFGRTTVSSRDIGIDLTVKPLIGPNGSVQLEIKQEVNDILGEITIDGNPQPRIGKRSTSSFVSVKSGEIIVLGGLQRGSESRSTSRLGPLPIIGDLLGSRSRGQTRTDLVFFLRPTVLTNTPADNTAALEQVEGYPKGVREQVKQALAPDPTP